MEFAPNPGDNFVWFGLFWRFACWAFAKGVTRVMHEALAHALHHPGALLTAFFGEDVADGIKAMMRLYQDSPATEKQSFPKLR